MSKKRWVMASLAAFIVGSILDFLFNNYCLKNVYMQTAQLWRPMDEMMKLMPYYHIVSLFAAFVFTYIYTKGYEAKPSGLFEGLRFGLLIGLLVVPSMAVITYATMPVPVRLSVGWFVTGMFQYAAIGSVVGLIYKK